MLQLVAHHIYRGGPLPPLSPGVLYKYYLAGNGLFLRASRVGLAVLMPLRAYRVRGLPPLEPYVQLDYGPVPPSLVGQLLILSRQAQDARGQSVEKLFYLSYATGEDGGGPVEGGVQGQGRGWRLAVPLQAATGGSVRPLESGRGSSYERALIEVHSHHTMPAFFSPTDDRDEARSFRVFGVVGHIFDRPEIQLRVGVFGHFWPIPARWLLELPTGLQDVTQVRRESHDEFLLEGEGSNLNDAEGK